MGAAVTRRRTVHSVAPSEPDCFRTIIDALTAANSGDVISIHPGTYRETLVLDRDITLSASGPPGQVRIETSGPPAVRMACERATLSGLVIAHDGHDDASVDVPMGCLRMEECLIQSASAASLWCHGEAEIIASGCSFGNSVNAGVMVADGATGQFSGCRFEQIAASAIVIRTGAAPRFLDCSITDITGSAVLAADGAQGVLERCVVTRAGNPAIAIEGGSSTVMRSVEVREADGAAFLIASGSAPTLQECVAVEARGQGLVLLGSGPAAVTGLKIHGCRGYGIQAIDGSLGTVVNAQIIDGVQVGVMVDSQSTTWFKDILVKGVQAGVVIQHGAAPGFLGLQLNSITGTGVHITSKARVNMQGVNIQTPGQLGIAVDDQATAMLSEVQIQGAGGAALGIDGGADVEVVDMTVLTTHGPAVSILRARVRLRGGQLSGDGTVGVEVGDGGVAELDRVSMRGFTTGLLWSAGSCGSATRCTISGSSADAVHVATDAPVTLTGCTVTDHGGQGVRVGPGGAQLQVIDLHTGHKTFPEDGLRNLPLSQGPLVTVAPAGRSPDVPANAGKVESGARLTQEKFVSHPPTGRPGRLHQMLAQLDSLIGLDTVKREVATLVRLHQMAERRSLAGLPAPPLSRHLVFTGAPGTGKTTVARLYGKILAELGVIDDGQLIETGRPDLVASIVGGTALKTTERFNQALGGVLFIDEAYTLAATGSGGPDFGREAVDTLVKLMEDHRDEVAVIVAGYTHEMRAFLATNPGLASRFSRTIEFADYTAPELVAIVEGFCQTHDYRLEYETRHALLTYFEHLPRDAAFGNGRSARKVFEEMIGRQAYRLADERELTTMAMTRLLPEDIGALPAGGVGAGAGAVDKDVVDKLLSDLREMVGLDNVKHEVENMVDLLASARQRKAAGLPAPSVSRHLIFAGPPGTGKTTIARLYGSVLAAMGVLQRGQVIEVGRSDLVASYVGQTAQRTAEAFNRARGGVLFIDEAYTLSAHAGGGADFGREAIDTLVKLMEDNRDEVVVIAAGYDREMETFLSANQGLASRFSHRIHFGNYSTDELVTIVSQHAAAAGYECDGPTISALRAHFDSTERGFAFGNGRYARQVLDEGITRHATRMRSITSPTVTDLSVLKAVDIPQARTVGMNGT